MNHSQIHKNNAAWWNENAVWYAERDIEEDIAFLRAGGIYLFNMSASCSGTSAPWCSAPSTCSARTAATPFLCSTWAPARSWAVDISERNWRPPAANRMRLARVPHGCARIF